MHSLMMNRTEKIKDKITCVMTEIQNSNEIGCCGSDQLYAYCILCSQIRKSKFFSLLTHKIEIAMMENLSLCIHKTVQMKSASMLVWSWMFVCACVCMCLGRNSCIPYEFQSIHHPKIGSNVPPLQTQYQTKQIIS